MEVLAIAVSQEKQIKRHKNGTEKPVFLDVFFLVEWVQVPRPLYFLQNWMEFVKKL